MHHSIEHVNWFIDHNSLNETSIRFAKRVKPQWCESEIKTKVFTDGITNRLVGCYVDSDADDLVLIRVYGEKTELFIDRNTEIRNLILMNKADLSPAIYYSFNNGICYGYTPGVVLDEIMVRDPEISANIARKMAQMHTIKLEDFPEMLPVYKNDPNTKEPCLFRVLRRYLQLIPSAYELEIQTSSFPSSLLTKSNLEEEVSHLEKELSQTQSPIVFCHNDLLLINIVYNKERNAVTFIDFEYADFNYEAFDIGNHFMEFCGVDSFNPNLYPESGFQCRWLRNYVIHLNDLNNKIINELAEEDIEDRVDRLYVQVNKFALAAHLFWGVWALIQSFHSALDFNFTEYARQRIQEYFAKKEEFLALEVASFKTHNGHS